MHHLTTAVGDAIADHCNNWTLRRTQRLKGRRRRRTRTRTRTTRTRRSIRVIIVILNLEENAETEGEGDKDEKPGDSKEDPAAYSDPRHKIRV